MPKYKIENYTDPVSVAEQDVTAFLEKYPNAVLIEEQIEEVAQDTTSADLLDPTTFQTDAAADADAVSQPMTASQAEYVEPEDTELVPVDTSLDSQDLANEDFTLEQFELMTPKEKNALSYSEKQRLSREKNNENNINIIDFSSDNFEKLEDKEKIRLQELAGKQITEQYSSEGIVDFEISENQIKEKAKELLKENKNPNLITSYGAQIARGFNSFAKGTVDFLDMTKFSLMEAGLEVFDDEYKSTPENKQAIMRAVKANIGSPVLTPSSLNFDTFSEKLDPYIRQYENESIVDDIAEGNYLLAGERAVGASLESLPSVVAAGLGLGGFIVLGTSSAGGKFDEEFEKDPSINTGILVANAIGSGIIEAGFEIATRGVLKRAGILSNSGNKKAALDLIRGGSEGLVKNLGINTISEAGSEAATKTTSLLLDAITLPGRTFDLVRDWKLIAEEAIVGSVFGISGTGAGAVKNRNVNAVQAAEYILMPDQVKKVVEESGENISKLYKNKANAEPEGVDLINEAIELETARILNIKKQNSRALNDMTPNEVKAYANNKSKINELKSTINKSGQEDVVKKLAEDKLKTLQEVNKTLFKESSDRRVERNIQSVEKMANEVEGLTFKPLENSNAVSEFIKENKIDVDNKKASEEQGFIYQNPETGAQTIIINKDVAKKQKAVNIAGHEFLHAVLFNTVKGSPETQVALGESLNIFINNIDPSKIKNSDFANRLKQYKDSSKATQGEEVLTLFSDALTSGDIKFNENVFTKVGDIIRRTLQSLGVKVRFNEGRDVYNFIKDYNKSVVKGRLTKTQAKATTEGVEGELVMPKVEAEPGIKESKQLTPEQDTQLRSDVAEIKKEASESEALAKKFNKDFIKGAKQTRLENKVLNEIKPVVERVITNRTKALYDPIVEDAKKLVSREMFQESMRSDIETMVLNEFTGKQDIEKFIVNRGFLRANNLAERLGIKNAEEGIDKNLDTAKTILVEETEKPKTDRPRYRNILKSNVLPTETTVKVKDKVLKTVRTLKSKLNTKISINKTVTPLIAEIKENMGKQADIDFKKAMGGKKDGQLKRFLIKNKKAILENMTTTWLVKAMPGAIQKQVDGNFTSDWQGKKIDREKTTTQQAGRTSGAEIVRRLPNAFKNLDDKTYLGYVVDESGAPIRGRKESLAKAMAEELSFDIFTAEIQDENSEISKAFEGNQEALGEVLADNFVQQVVRDAERGTVKFSMSVKSKSNIKELLNSEIENIKAKNPKYNDSIEYILNTKLLKELDEIKTIEDLLKTLYSETVNTYGSTNIANRARIKILNLIARNTGNTISSEEIFNTFQKAVTRDLWKYEKQVIGFGYSLTNLENNIKKDRVKAIKDWFKYDSRVIRTQKIQNITRNLDAFKYLKSKGIALDGFEVTFNDNKTRSYIEYKGERLFNLTDVTDIKKNFEYRGDIINKQAEESKDYMLNTIKKGVENGDLGAINGWIALMYEDQRGPIRKSSKIGRFVENYQELSVKDLILEHETEAYYIYKAYQDLANNYSEAKIKETKDFLDTAFVNLVSKEIDAALKAAKEKGFNNKARYRKSYNLKNAKLSKSIGELNLVETGQKAINNATSLAYNNNVKRLDVKAEDISELTTNKAKADWLINKIAEGYNDFYFIDNKMNEVKAVKNVLNTFDVKGKVQQAKVKFSKSMNTTFNEMLQRSTGIEAGETIERSIARRRGATKGKFKVWMPSSLDDFKGLTSYTFAGKGKQGEADQKFFQDALITPYFRGIRAIEQSRQAFKDDFKTLNKQMRPVLKKLGKIVPGTEFTHDQAIRVALWTASGYDIPGISESDIKTLVDFVNDNADLSEYARKLQLISKRNEWSKPGDFWDAETILSDLNNLTEKVGRKEYLTEFIENADIIFSEDNLNKVEAGYGEAQKDALKDIIYRMKNGTNRPSGANKNENRFNNWVNNSIGAIMFFNRRSALLQTLSIANFINWGDNNVLKAGAAFANQPQYWKDFATLFNSSKLKQRRSGLKSDVNEAEIANAVKGSRNKAVSALSYLLKIGFTPTQLADSFAIASGGATFYRNRANSYLKEVNSEGEKVYTQKQAEEKAFEDFSQISEETQQSGDPALISSDQASTLGRMILAFQNTPIQLNRSIKKAALDIKNRRRTSGQTMLQSDFSNISKIIYYGTVQNIIFSALQNALFALIPGFEDEDDELTEEEQLEKYGKIYSTKQSRIVNGMVDTTLKGGFGVPGAFISTIKNAYLEYAKQKEKGFIGDQGYTILAAANLSPPVGSKLRKIYSAIKTEEFDKDIIAKRGWDITIDGKFNLSPKYKVLGSVTEGLTNLPLDRMVAEVSSITEALDARNSKWQRIALALGWKTWDVNVKNEEHELIKTEAKAKRKEEGKEKAKETRAKNKKIKKLQNERRDKAFDTLSSAQRKETYKMNTAESNAYLDKIAKQKGIK